MKRLIPLKILAVACVTGLIGCSPAAPAKNPKNMTGEELKAELQRCGKLGLKVYEDEACQVAQQERQDRFLGKSKGPGS